MPRRFALLRALCIGGALAFFSIAPAWAAQTNPPNACAAAPNVLDWTTATEVNTAGFNLYRSTSPTGPYEKINSELIATTAQALTGGKYEYEDKGVQAGQTYYYELEDVEFSGTATKHDPITVSTAAALPFCLTTEQLTFGVLSTVVVLTLVVLVLSGPHPRAKSET